MTPRGPDERGDIWTRYATSTTSDGVPMYDAMLRLRTTTRAWQAFFDELPREGSGTAADYGCGPGIVTRVLAEQNPAARIVGIDRENAFLERAKRDLGGFANTELRRGDLAARLPLADGEVDFVGTHNFVIPYLTLEEQRSFVRELARVQAPGSTVLGSTMLHPFTFRDVVISNMRAELSNLKALWVGLKELVPQVASQLDRQMKLGWMNYPTLDQLRDMHREAGFASFEVIAPIMPLRHLVKLWKGASHAGVVFRAVRGG